jgi:hypothetical protein
MPTIRERRIASLLLSKYLLKGETSKISRVKLLKYCDKMVNKKGCPHYARNAVVEECCTNSVPTVVGHLNEISTRSMMMILRHLDNR